MIVAIVGSRDYPPPARVKRFVAALARKHPRCLVISGGARGVDRLAETEARSYGLMTRVFPADWQRYGRSAGYRRNEQIVAAADILVAFWDGRSPGTHHSIELARRKGIRVFVYGPEAATPATKDLPPPSAPAAAPQPVNPATARRDRAQQRAIARQEAADECRGQRWREWWDHELGEGADRPMPRDTVYLPDDAPVYRYYSDAMSLINRLED